MRRSGEEGRLDHYGAEPQDGSAAAVTAGSAAHGERVEAQWERVSEILAAVNGRWAIPIMRHLASGISRPAVLLNAVNARPETRLSRKVMFEALHRMTEAGMVRRVQISARPRQTGYWLTDEGREILSEVSKLGRSDSRWPPAMEQDPEPPRGIDVTIAHPARTWDYWLGGKDNFAPDREAGVMVARAMPSLPALARSARLFQADAVESLAGHGVRQFLDIGASLPAAGSAHEIAQRAAPESRIVYVDNDPLAVAHGRALMSSDPRGKVTYVEADLRDTRTILGHADLVFDKTLPVAVLLVGVLHFVPDGDDPWSIMARLVDAITASDCYLVIGHGASDIKPEESARMAEEYNRRSAVPITMRNRLEVARFFDGMEMLQPGLVPLDQWPSASRDARPAVELAGYAGIGRRRGASPH